MTYNHIVEGTLALTGYFAWHKICAERGILPGMQQVIKHIGDDERRHMAWGTFTCRRHVAADDANWDLVDERMQELMVPAMGVVTGTVDRFPEGETPFGIDINELAEYAMDKLGRRLGAIESARGADLHVIDVDAEPGDPRGAVPRRGRARAGRRGGELSRACCMAHTRALDQVSLAIS